MNGTEMAAIRCNLSDIENSLVKLQNSTLDKSSVAAWVNDRIRVAEENKWSGYGHYISALKDFIKVMGMKNTVYELFTNKEADEYLSSDEKNSTELKDKDNE